jgi:valyl-tRNA synthetase
MGRNFANKIWNAFNVFGQFMEEGRTYERKRDFAELELAEQWMLTRLRDTVEAVEDDLSRYRLNEALQKIYHGFWSDYCDWYLELIKPPYGEQMSEDRIALAAWIYERLLELLHPFMPFVTEELWHRLRSRADGDALIAAGWPEAGALDADAGRAATFAALQEMIESIRSVKSDYGVGQGQEIAASVRADGADGLAGAVRRHADYFEKMAGVTELAVGPDEEKPPASAAKVAGESEVFVPLEGMIDLDKERERLRSEIADKRSFLDGVKRKLQNEQFLNKAPAEVVERERQKRRDATDELERLRANLDDLG